MPPVQCRFLAGPCVYCDRQGYSPGGLVPPLPPSARGLASQAHRPSLSTTVATAPGCRYHNALLTIRGNQGANRHLGYLTEPFRPDPWNSIELVMQVSELNSFLSRLKVAVQP